MKISFVVPVFNAEKTLQNCIECLLNQKGCDYEIILVDDGSIDNSSKICDAYAKDYSNIIKVIHKKNEGSFLARKTGFEKASGEWIICVDADDIVSNKLIEKVYETINKFECDLIIYDYVKIYHNNEERITFNFEDKSVFSNESKNEIYILRLLNKDFNPLWSKAFKKELLQANIKIDNEGIRTLSDDAVQILPIITNAKKIVYIKEPLYKYDKRTENSITSRNDLESWVSQIKCFKITNNYLKYWDIDEITKFKYFTKYAEFYANYIRWLFNSNIKRLNDIIYEVSNSQEFISVYNNYCKRYLKTKYLQISVPIVLSLIKHNNFIALQFFFKVESLIRRF